MATIKTAGFYTVDGRPVPLEKGQVLTAPKGADIQQWKTELDMYLAAQMEDPEFFAQIDPDGDLIARLKAGGKV